MEKPDSLSVKTCWFAAVSLLHPDLLNSAISLSAPSTTAGPTGWPAFLHIVRTPSYGRIHTTCLEHLDALSLFSLHNCREEVRKKVGSGDRKAKLTAHLIGVSEHEIELLDALLELAGQPTGLGDAQTQTLFSRVSLFCLLYNAVELPSNGLHVLSTKKRNDVCFARQMRKVIEVIKYTTLISFETISCVFSVTNYTSVEKAYDKDRWVSL